jgi:hypothetical protein
VDEVVTETETTFYEVLPHIIDENDQVTLAASFTASNGIRIGLADRESDDPDWREFYFTQQQAEMIGQALVRWAQRCYAEGELIRCNYKDKEMKL